MTAAEFLLAACIGLLPVVVFLLVLRLMDSYKLVSLRMLAAIIVAGGLLAGVSYLVNGSLLSATDWSFGLYSRYLAPPVEELCKAVVVIYLFRTHRIGFLVDAAIFGFAAGAGFAVVENFYLLNVLPETHVGVWIVRGFGTAIMHGGVTAIFAVMAQALTERNMRVSPRYFVPGFVLAVALHSVFNHFFFSPLLSTIIILLTLPPIFYVVFQRSAHAMHEWLELDFDADADLIEQIESGEFTETRIGRFLTDLKEKFRGPVVVDMLCYLRIYTELALRAKGVLMMRENGIETTVGKRTREKFAELRFLEHSIGRTGRLAMQPFLQMDRKDYWQINVLEEMAQTGDDA